MFDINHVSKALTTATENGDLLVAIGTDELASLIAAYKQLQYQNERGRQHAVSVTETDQNPA